MPLAKTYLPEIHDLHPGMADRLDRMIEAFPPAASAHIAFSVVPNWMDAAPLNASPDFVQRIKALPGKLVLHGWTHTKGPSVLNWLLYDQENRSEFAGLSQTETERRIDAGLAMFDAAGLARPTWFCAPRWTASASLHQTLFDRGFEGHLARNALDLSNSSLPVPPLNFDEGGREWKIAPGRVLREAVISRLLSAEKPFRLVLHPDDLDHPKTFAQFERTVARMTRDGWTPVSIETLTAEAAP